MVKKLLLLLLLIFSHHAESVVKFLPGFEGPLPFELETGYIGVGEQEEVQLFYYFIKSERNPKEDPLLLWISGGPGCSSFTGLFFENGPLTFKSEGYNGGSPTLVSTSYSWSKAATILYLDQPIGTGFSYSTTQLLDRLSDTGEAKRIYEFIRKWLGKHQEFISNPFYIGGDSYSGKVIPAAVQEISKGNDLGFTPRINLQGYVLGSPITDIEAEFNSRIPFSYGMGLISDELHNSLRKICRGKYKNVDPRNVECSKFVDEFRKCTSGLNEEHILRPTCDITFPTPKDVSRRYLKGLLPTDLSVIYHNCIVHNPPYMYTDLLTSVWANDESVRKALNVVKGTIGEWERCVWDLPYDQDITNTVPYHMNNTIKGYRSLIYSGDHDFSVPFISTLQWIKSLNSTIIDDWRPWTIHNQITGYTRSYANKMTFATVKGGGHTAQYKPEETSIMFQRWISGQPI